MGPNPFGSYTHEAKSLLRDIEFSEHVLVKRVVNVDLHPFQADHTLLELFRELAIHNGAAPGGVHICNDRVRAPARCRVVIGTDCVAAIHQAFGEQTEVEESQISQVFVAISPKGRGHLTGGLSEHLKHVPQLLSRFIFEPIHIFDLNKFRQQVREVLDRVGIAMIQLAHPALRHLLEEVPDRMVCRNLRSRFLYHALIPLVT